MGGFGSEEHLPLFAGLTGVYKIQSVNLGKVLWITGQGDFRNSKIKYYQPPPPENCWCAACMFFTICSV